MVSIQFGQLTSVIKNTRSLLERVRAGGVDSHVELLPTKLAPDMYSFEKQLWFVYEYTYDFLIQAGATRRLVRSKWRWPKLKLVEQDEELAALLKTIEVIELLDPPPHREVVIITSKDNLPLIMNKTLDQMFLLWTLPNVTFHYTIAYALARRAGYNIGKGNFLMAQVRELWENEEWIPENEKTNSPTREERLQQVRGSHPHDKWLHDEHVSPGNQN